MTALALAVVGAATARRWARAQPQVVGGAVWGLLTVPIATTALLAVLVAARHWRRATAVTRRRTAADADTVLLADLVALGVASGKTVRGALEQPGPTFIPNSPPRWMRCWPRWNARARHRL